MSTNETLIIDFNLEVCGVIVCKKFEQELIFFKAVVSKLIP